MAPAFSSAKHSLRLAKYQFPVHSPGSWILSMTLIAYAEPSCLVRFQSLRQVQQYSNHIAPMVLSQGTLQSAIEVAKMFLTMRISQR